MNVTESNRQLVAEVLGQKPEDIQWITWVEGYDKYEVKVRGTLNPVEVTGPQIDQHNRKTRHAS